EHRMEPLPEEEHGTDADRMDRYHFGELTLNVQPADTMVDLDGRFLGMVDMLGGSQALRRIPVGRHSLRFRRAGYQTVERGIYLIPGRPVSVKLSLEKA